MLEKESNETILRIYDSASDARLWPGVLQHVAERVNAVGSIVFEWQREEANSILTASFASVGYDRAVLNDYLVKRYKEEARDQEIFERHSLLKDDIDLVDDQVLAGSVDELRRLRNVEVLQKMGILHRSAGLLNKDNKAISRFSLQFAAARGRMTPEERQYMATILPHLAKALDLGRPAVELNVQEKGMLAALDQLSIGICILDPSSRLVQTNFEFRRQIDAHRVFEIDANGTLRMVHSDHEAVFANLKHHALNHGKFGARPRKEAITAASNAVLCVEVVPLDRAVEIGSSIFGGYTVFSVDTSLPFRCDTTSLRAAFQLTKTETLVCDLIAMGLSNAQIAERRERSIETINTQVKSILTKTGCNSRTQLVRLMMSFGGNFLSPFRLE